MLEAAVWRHAGMQRVLSGMAEGRVAQVMGQRHLMPGLRLAELIGLELLRGVAAGLAAFKLLLEDETVLKIGQNVTERKAAEKRSMCPTCSTRPPAVSTRRR